LGPTATLRCLVTGAEEYWHKQRILSFFVFRRAYESYLAWVSFEGWFLYGEKDESHCPDTGGVLRGEKTLGFWSNMFFPVCHQPVKRLGRVFLGKA